MVKVKTFRGKSEEDLRKITLDELLPLLNSRDRRAVKRAATKNVNMKDLMKKVAEIKGKNPSKLIKTHCRSAVILPDWIGLTFGVHAGKGFKEVMITIDKVGMRLGDFAHTTGKVVHSGPGVGATRGSKFIPLK
jgi:small subunit ribosomal protein S19